MTITDILNEARSVDSKQPTLLLLSGGSAFSLLNHFDESVLSAIAPQLTLGVLDERYTDVIENRNSYALEQTLFYKKAVDGGIQYIDVFENTGDLSLETCDRLFEKKLRDWRDEYPDGVVVVTMGLGADGHTAGIFPSHKTGVEWNVGADEWVCGYEFDSCVNPHTVRITTTPSFLLQQVDVAYVYARGTDKKEIIEQVKSSTSFDPDFPASVLGEMKRVVWV